MGLRYLLLSLMLPFLSFQAGAVGTRDSGKADAPGSRVPKTVSKEPAVWLAAYLLDVKYSGRMDILAVTYERLVPVTPETIESNYDYKISVAGPIVSPLQRALVHALETSAIERVDEGPRFCHWAVICYDLKGERVLTMYFGGYGQGLINGTPVLMGAEVEQVLQRRCAPLWE